MAVEKKFLNESIHKLRVKKFIRNELRNAGISEISIQETPIATRIAISARRPSLVIGKKGKTIKNLADFLTAEFGIQNPQIDILEVENPLLDAMLMAEKIARQIEIERNIKLILRNALKDIMGAGGVGAEIIAAGKVVGKGARAKAIRVRKGILKKSGTLKNLVKKGKAVANLKAGIIGVTVRIVTPDTVFPDTLPKELKQELERKMMQNALSAEKNENSEGNIQAEEEKAEASGERQQKPN